VLKKNPDFLYIGQKSTILDEKTEKNLTIGGWGKKNFPQTK